jgi:uncharacterized membrane protein YkvA (DUF1232 family)
MRTQRLDEWRQRVRSLKTEVHAVYLASKDPRVPWYAKALVACVLAYLFSPIDLIPDFIPVVGHLDDLIIVPLGLLLVIRLIPHEVMAEHREAARVAALEERPTWIAAVVIVGVWTLLLGLAIRFLWRYFAHRD